MSSSAAASAGTDSAVAVADSNAAAAAMAADLDADSEVSRNLRSLRVVVLPTRCARNSHIGTTTLRFAQL